MFITFASVETGHLINPFGDLTSTSSFGENGTSSSTSCFTLLTAKRELALGLTVNSSYSFRVVAKRPIRSFSSCSSCQTCHGIASPCSYYGSKSRVSWFRATNDLCHLLFSSGVPLVSRCSCKRLKSAKSFITILINAKKNLRAG